MFVVLRRSAEQEQATLELLIGQLHDPHSANYHNCLTADELRTRFGPAQEDINTVVRRLSSLGFTVHLVHQMGMTVEVSATAAQVQDAGTIPRRQQTPKTRAPTSPPISKALLPLRIFSI
jgi:trimeric autotransporter adhesin